MARRGTAGASPTTVQEEDDAATNEQKEPPTSPTTGRRASQVGARRASQVGARRGSLGNARTSIVLPSTQKVREAFVAEGHEEEEEVEVRTSILDSDYVAVRRMCNTDHPWRKRWDLLVIICVSVDALMTPFLAAFNQLMGRQGTGYDSTRDDATYARGLGISRGRRAALRFGPRTGRSDAVAAASIFRGDESRRRTRTRPRMKPQVRHRRVAGGRHAPPDVHHHLRRTMGHRGYRRRAHEAVRGVRAVRGRLCGRRAVGGPRVRGGPGPDVSPLFSAEVAAHVPHLPHSRDVATMGPEHPHELERGGHRKLHHVHLLLLALRGVRVVLDRARAGVGISAGTTPVLAASCGVGMPRRGGVAAASRRREPPAPRHTSSPRRYEDSNTRRDHYEGGGDLIADAQTWLDLVAGWQTMSTKLLYVKSLYWTMSTMTTVGYGDLTPVSTKEHWYAICVMLFGSIIFGYIFGLMASLVASMDVTMSAFRMKVDSVQRFLHYRNVPRELCDRVHRYHDNTWAQTRGFDELAIMRDLPTSIHLDLALHLYHDLLVSVPLFRDAEPAFVRALVLRLTPRVFPEQEKIVLKGAGPGRKIQVPSRAPRGDAVPNARSIRVAAAASTRPDGVSASWPRRRPVSTESLRRDRGVAATHPRGISAS